ncbi:hypothetical protein CPB83DRAFT_867950 [Crepidotus variabilis]|uniref:ubiquitinyl hydrolase 1 n=1 Tax=Crepidotus variabilis TaxID=179855 RepID=A0A9P6ENI0_9AGAR|nr:hypothetical protein CPB83DRAFT_867950 [Crepidotus variabilis]
MDNPDAPKARRPLPTPGAPMSPRPDTPVLNSSGVSPASFYAPAGTKPPPLPSRPKNSGSSHTAYIPPAQEPPTYNPPSPGFREPELVTDEAIADDDSELPALIPQESTWPEIHTNWHTDQPTWGVTGWQNSTSSDWDKPPNSGINQELDAMDYMSSNASYQDFVIDGRTTREETLWWNPEEWQKHRRPGPGFLPPILAEELHDANHSLFSVGILGMPPTTSSNKDPSPASVATSASTSDSPPPTEQEVRLSIPHPNAYYCRKDNGWVILSWKSSSGPLPLAQTFEEVSDTHPLPDQGRRLQTASCIDDPESTFTRNQTHHFHKYPKAVDGLKLNPPLRADEWDRQQRRAGAVISGDVDDESLQIDEVESSDSNEGQSGEGRLLDLYLCCQCRFSVVASGIIPGVIPKQYLDEMLKDKRHHPGLGRSAEQSVALTAETIITAMENRLWKGNNRCIKVHSQGFQTKVGWNSNIKRIFETLGFTEETSNQEVTLRPPAIEAAALFGKQNRRKLLRSWLELSCWLAEFKRTHEYKIYIQLTSAREEYQTAIGAHPDQIPRGLLSDSTLHGVQDIESWKSLGLTATTFSPELLGFAYLAQCRCDPQGTAHYFSNLAHIAKELGGYGNCPAKIQDLVVMEQSRDRFTFEDAKNATTVLGFGTDNLLRVDYDEDVPEDFLEHAWKDAIKRAWRDDSTSESLHVANNAFRILAELRNSVKLKYAFDTGKSKLDPDKAYNTLEIPKEVEEDIVVTVYQMRLDETPNQLEKMREALMCIAEARDSDRLRQLASSGTDPGVITVATPADRPRGLNQLGNTCYLNSLLQYFYTIKELREAVLPMSKLDLKAIGNEKLSEEDLKKHRVGGRLVTRREIVRSRKFINQLADLFYNLEYSENPAVTPTLELAKLALVTSRDEEEDEVDKGGTDSSNDTDATLVEDGPSRPTIDTTGVSQSPGKSVLGKRGRDIAPAASEMEVDSPIAQSPKDKDGFVMISRKSPPTAQTAVSEPEASSSKVQAPISEAPKAPPRKRPEPSDSTMMFGKQHDVAECMDNCMFQIETALLRFDEVSDMDDKTSVVKRYRQLHAVRVTIAKIIYRLFYGKIRQRITGVELSQSRSSIHEKEDLFSHLPVNVANDGIDIYDGLSGYFDDTVDFQGRKARMEVTLVDLPPILQIQLQRVQFNRETLQPYKSQAYVKFGESLYMDRFMDNADPTKKAKSKAIQSQLSACRERVRLLVEGKETPFSSSLEHTSKFLTQMRNTSMPVIEEELIQQLQEEQTRVHKEIDGLRRRIDILKNDLETLWMDSMEAAYELTSVFIHRGSSPSWGHYFFYSRNLPGSPDSWFKYNDSDVTVVEKQDVLADTTGSTANPYLLVFARKGADIVDTVKRFEPSSLESVQ